CTREGYIVVLEGHFDYW
nr:immunoglobulin heavy chain junction region [Macaca mulatta]MPN71124.1 immunoglobulin heavy chain junction region [Macaca mulatta]MPN73891.1 immunoglobulin heavy chain junction region [Macaca mulatta]MPN74434.1 immunoglobulin heavy chain junction region [Macaca mulatta]MPN74672.1 immunoglobulin heavy chain junction region [Macaca mulatta]